MRKRKMGIQRGGVHPVVICDIWPIFRPHTYNSEKFSPLGMYRGGCELRRVKINLHDHLPCEGHFLDRLRS